MGCCSGGSDDVYDCSDAQGSRGSNSSTQIKPKINLDNYTYFPGTIRQTDYTNSQIRTGWASEMDRKRNISKTIYYSPSYVVLGHHGYIRSPRNTGDSSISQFISRNPIEKKKKTKKDRSLKIENCEEIKGPYIKKRKNYFGKD